MKIGLTVSDRIHVLNLLPTEGSYVTVKAIRDFTTKVGFTATEIVDMEIVEKDGIVTWNEKGKQEVVFDFIDAEAELVRRELRKIDAEEKITNNIFSVYEKFMC